MRLDFNILWVEDNQGNVYSQRDRIATLVRKEGFDLKVAFAASVDEATSYLSDDIYGDHIDLILIDYDLGSGKSGGDGLTEIRDMFHYKDIIFYSGQAPGDLAEIVKQRNIQGVFTSHRNDLPDVVLGVFENLVRKVLDIEHSRGIVMGATSDIDQIINDSLGALFDQCDDSQRKLSIDAVLKRIKQKREDFDKSAALIEAISHLSDLSAHHMIYTSDDRLRLLQKVMKFLALHGAHEERFDSYRSGVVQRRNDLAHIRVEVKGFSRKLYDRHGKELTSDDMRALRVALLEFRELLDSLFGRKPAAQ